LLEATRGPHHYAMEQAESYLYMIAALRDEVRALQHYITILEWQNRYLTEQLKQADLHVEILSPTRIDS
jgi:hypothetical protein